MIVMNPRKGRRSRRKHSRRRRSNSTARFVFKNPSLSGATSAVKRGFSAESVKLVLPIAAGAVANVYASEFTAAHVPDFPYKDKLMPFITAGGLLAGSVLLKQAPLGFKLFTGAMTQAVIKTLLPYIVQFTGDPGTAFSHPIMPSAMPKALPAPAQMPAMSEFIQSGMNEFIQN